MPQKVLVGFDGSVDRTVKPIRIAGTPNQYFATIEDYGKHITSKAGLSCSLQNEVIKSQAGGNSVFVAQSLNAQGYDEPTGKAKITPAYNLPCRFVLHTVGPIVTGKLTETHCRQLADCYRSCLELAVSKGLKSIAFCCISTGEFHFPQEKAAEIAVQTVRNFLQNEERMERVVFNVFKEEDYNIYKRLLG